MQQHIQEVSVKIADAAAAGSIGTAAIVNLADLNTMVQIAAGAAAILAGTAAAIFHMYKTYDLHKARVSHDEDRVARNKKG